MSPQPQPTRTLAHAPAHEPIGSFAYEHTDIPAQLTISEWRARSAGRPRRRALSFGRSPQTAPARRREVKR